MSYHFLVVVLALAALTPLHQTSGSPPFDRPLDTFSKREPHMIGLSSYDFDPVISAEEGRLEEKLSLAQKLYDDILNDINDILDVEESPYIFPSSADPSSFSTSSLPSSEPLELNTPPMLGPKSRQPTNKSRRHLWNILSNVNSRFSKI